MAVGSSVVAAMVSSKHSQDDDSPWMTPIYDSISSSHERDTICHYTEKSMNG